MARILFPADFGIVAAASLVLSYVLILQDLGLTTSIIQRQDHVEEVLDSAFVLRNLLGLGQVAIVILVAAPVSAFFGDARLTLVLIVLSSTIILGSLATVPQAILHKNLKVRTATKIQMVGATGNIIVAVGLALFGFSYWSLVYGNIAGNVIILALSWAIVKWRPRRRWNWIIGKKVLSFSALVTIESIFYVLGLTIDNIAVGGLYGITALGIYTVAFSFGNYPNSLIAGIVSRVIFPVYSLVSSQREKLREAYRSTFYHVSLLSIPAAFGISTLAGPLVMVFLGPRWTAVIPLLQILVINGLFRSLGAGAQQAIIAIGRPGLAAKIQGVSAGLLALLVLPAAHLDGIQGIAVAVTFTSMATLAIQLWAVATLLGYGIRSQLRLTYHTVAASVVMTVALGGVSFLLGYAPFSGVVSESAGILLLLVALGIISYGAALVVLTDGGIIQETKDAIRLATSMLKPDSSSDT